ncbi:MAG: ATP-grasp domain-containing protein [Nanoarchaeota archaeon]
MKKTVIGFIFKGKYLGKDEETFLKIAKDKNVEVVFFDLTKDLDIKELKDRLKKCDIVYNNSAEDFSIEFEKTIEGLGKKVIDSTKSHYKTEDKWFFYLKCVEHKIPTPETILLSENIKIAEGELSRFRRWPVILKRVEGTCGEFVEKAENIKESTRIIKKWKKENSYIPIIAQEFIKSPSYRVTTIGKKIVQTALKQSKGWKATGVYAKNIGKFDLDKNLVDIVKKINNFSGIKICGIDFLKKNGEWLALEINSAPGFDFFESERKKLLGEVLDFLKKEAKH